MALMHRCPDGTRTALSRHGPVGTLDGVTLSCPRCGYARTARDIEAEAEALRLVIVAALAPKENR